MLAWVLVAALVLHSQGLPVDEYADGAEEISTIDPALSETSTTVNKVTSINTITEPPTTPQPASPCGVGWTKYGDEKCIQLIPGVFMTKDDAEDKCKSLSSNESSPTLVTIKTLKDQDFLENYVFDELKSEEGIWLGLKATANNTVFEWNDDTPLGFANWGNKLNFPTEKIRCVKMEAEDDDHPIRGKWYRTSCKKTGAVVCEKSQPFDQAKELKNLKSKVFQLEQNTVPVGSIYIQLPDQAAPFVLWPKMTWENISAEYAGLFFRVEGGEAAPFGEIQNDTTRHLVEVQASTNVKNKWDAPSMIKKGWSDPVFSGSNAGQQIGLKFRLSDAEVRPRNQAVVVWKRVA